MIRNGDASVHNLTAANRVAPVTCADCGVPFARKGAAKRCKPCGSEHQEKAKAQRDRERKAHKRLEAGK